MVEAFTLVLQAGLVELQYLQSHAEYSVDIVSDNRLRGKG